MPRPKLDRVSYTATMPRPMLDIVDRAAARAGITRSALLERACRKLLKLRTGEPGPMELGEFPAGMKGQESPTRLVTGDTNFSGQES